MRQSLVAGNWKMHGTKASVSALLRTLLSEASNVHGVELVVFPPFVFLEQTEKMLAASPIRWGAQNVYFELQGAYTGEISPSMLMEWGCRYVLVGHSERRTLFGEDDALIAKKFFAAFREGLHPVLCVGETLSERQEKKTEQIISRQLQSVLSQEVGVLALKNAVIAYEPVWAIGTGVSATPEQAQEAHAFIRQFVAKYDENVAQRLRIIYGGSVKAASAKALFAMPDIDGGLVGGASLNVQEFIEIAKLCK